MEAIVADLQNQLGKKNTFEGSVTSLASLFHDRYASASPAEKKAMYTAACRAGALLQSRYTGKGFWIAGQKLFQEAECAVTDLQERATMRSWNAKALQFLYEDNPEEQHRQHSSQPSAGPSSSFLFEGQLTVGAEPPPPAWLVAQNAAAALAVAEQEPNYGAMNQQVLDQISSMMQVLRNWEDGPNPDLEAVIEATLQASQKKPPPASKDEVAKLPVIQVTEEVLSGLGEGTECAVCREVLVIADQMQEMPCKHYFHPPCLKPWLDEHNSCPICRYELRTDDHDYESRKEREREAEADRKGAANAVRDDALMYI